MKRLVESGAIMTVVRITGPVDSALSGEAAAIYSRATGVRRGEDRLISASEPFMGGTSIEEWSRTGAGNQQCRRERRLPVRYSLRGIDSMYLPVY